MLYFMCIILCRGKKMMMNKSMTINSWNNSHADAKQGRAYECFVAVVTSSLEEN